MATYILLLQCFRLYRRFKNKKKITCWLKHHVLFWWTGYLFDVWSLTMIFYIFGLSVVYHWNTFNWCGESYHQVLMKTGKTYNMVQRELKSGRIETYKLVNFFNCSGYSFFGSSCSRRSEEVIAWNYWSNLMYFIIFFSLYPSISLMSSLEIAFRTT